MLVLLSSEPNVVGFAKTRFPRGSIMDDRKTDNLPASSRFDWSDIRIFLAVADYGSMNGASQSLNMSQSTISLRMRDLEQRLGSKLLARSKAGVCLTEAGE